MGFRIFRAKLFGIIRKLSLKAIKVSSHICTHTITPTGITHMNYVIESKLVLTQFLMCFQWQLKLICLKNGRQVVK